jgi:DNA-binding response OmpR family regulator
MFRSAWGLRNHVCDQLNGSLQVQGWYERNARLTMRPHIVFADDDSDIREMVQFILHAAGFRVSTPDNAADVLRLVITEHVDAVLLDYWMSEITGIELCSQIRTFDQSTPILMCSGAVTEADRKGASLAGAQGYLGKPFNARDLVGAIRSCLKAS